MRRQLRKSAGPPQHSQPPSFTGEAGCLRPNPSWGAAEGNVGGGPSRPVPGAAGCPDSQASRSPISAPALFLQQPPSRGETDAQKARCQKAVSTLPAARLSSVLRPPPPARGTSGQPGEGSWGAPAGFSVLMAVLPKRRGHSPRTAGSALRAAARRPAEGPRVLGRVRQGSGVRPSSRGSVLWGAGGESAPQARSGQQG